MKGIDIKADRVMLAVGLLVFLVGMPAIIHAQAQAADAGGTSLFATMQEYWPLRFFLNVAGYATIIVPGMLLIRLVRQSGYLDKAGSGCSRAVVQLCVQGQEPEKGSLEEAGVKAKETAKPKETLCRQCLVLVWCAAGLLGSYLTWGLLQERIMAFEYGKTDTEPGEHFVNSQFLVFMNRILAFVVAMLYMVCTAQPRHTAPLYKYSYSSLSNIMSSWCQYEALKFVSFPVQVLAKSSKVIPVMLMGKLVSKKSYAYHEYLTALLISVGVSVFLLSGEDSVRGDGQATTISGILILLGYLTFDAFTSNWQGELFKQHNMTSMQMMAGVNLFSVLFTTVSLAEQGGFFDSVAFMLKYPAFLWHVTLLSITSATGQLFIFYTISRFGPITFTIIMTIRQGVAILLSCLIYGHPVNASGMGGVLIVFAAIFIRTYLSHKPKPKPAPLPLPPVEEQPLGLLVTNGKA